MSSGEPHPCSKASPEEGEMHFEELNHEDLIVMNRLSVPTQEDSVSSLLPCEDTSRQ